MKLFPSLKFRAPLAPIQIPPANLLKLVVVLFWLWCIAGSIVGKFTQSLDPVWRIVCTQSLVDFFGIILFFAISRYVSTNISESGPENACKFSQWWLPIIGVLGAVCLANFCWDIFLSLINNLLLLHLNLESQSFVGIIKNISSEYQLIAMLFLVSVIGPVAEELFFRYFFYRSLKNYISAHWAVLIVAFIFALMHGNWLAFGGTFVISVGLTFIYERTRNLWASIIAHGLNNALAFMYIFISEVLNFNGV